MDTAERRREAQTLQPQVESPHTRHRDGAPKSRAARGHSLRWAGPEPAAKLLFSRENNAFRAHFTCYSKTSESQTVSQKTLEILLWKQSVTLQEISCWVGPVQTQINSLGKGTPKETTCRHAAVTGHPGVVPPSQMLMARRTSSPSRKPAYFMPVFCSSDV